MSRARSSERTHAAVGTWARRARIAQQQCPVTRDGACQHERMTSSRLIALLVVVLATACGNDDGGGGAAPSTTGTSTTAASGDDAAASGCPEDEPARGDPADVALDLDADGDGSDDEVRVHVVDDRTIELAVTYAAGGRTVVTYDDGSVATFASNRVARVADVDADGDEDVWVVVGAGASVEIMSLVLADGCDLVRPTADGLPNNWPVGASVGAASGIECVDLDGDERFDGFVEHSATRSREGQSGQGRYRGTSTEWAVEDRELERGEERPLDYDVESDPVTRYAELTC